MYQYGSFSKVHLQLCVHYSVDCLLSVEHGAQNQLDGCIWQAALFQQSIHKVFIFLPVGQNVASIDGFWLQSG